MAKHRITQRINMSPINEPSNCCTHQQKRIKLTKTLNRPNSQIHSSTFTCTTSLFKTLLSKMKKYFKSSLTLSLLNSNSFSFRLHYLLYLKRKNFYFRIHNTKFNSRLHYTLKPQSTRTTFNTGIDQIVLVLFFTKVLEMYRNRG